MRLLLGSCLWLWSFMSVGAFAAVPIQAPQVMVSVYGDAEQLGAFRSAVDIMIQQKKLLMPQEPWLYRGDMAFYVFEFTELGTLHELSKLHTLLKNMTYESDRDDWGLKAGTAAVSATVIGPCREALVPEDVSSDLKQD